MPELHHPLPPDVRARLRRAVLDHALGEHRRVFAPLVHVGVPGEVEHVVAAEGEALDHADRVDVLAALLHRAGTATQLPLVVWLTRSAEPTSEELTEGDVEDVDLVWLAAARAATEEAGLDLTMVVVDRHGWRDPRTGTQVRWRRMRVR